MAKIDKRFSFSDVSQNAKMGKGNVGQVVAIQQVAGVMANPTVQMDLTKVVASSKTPRAS